MFTTALHKNERSFDIMEVPSYAVEWIINFAYLRDTSFIDASNACEIYIVADYFGVGGLMKACVDFMSKILTPENCIGYWLMARYVSITSSPCGNQLKLLLLHIFFSITQRPFNRSTVGQVMELHN